jgi:hypothetical protein
LFWPRVAIRAVTLKCPFHASAQTGQLTSLTKKMRPKLETLGVPLAMPHQRKGTKPLCWFATLKLDSFLLSFSQNNARKTAYLRDMLPKMRVPSSIS